MGKEFHFKSRALERTNVLLNTFYHCLSLSSYLSLCRSVGRSLNLSLYLCVSLSGVHVFLPVALLRCLFAFMSLCVYVYMCLCLSIGLWVGLYVFLFACVSVCWSPALSICLYICICLYVNLCLFVSLFFTLSLGRSVCVSLFLSLCL